jgi:circadian clock protein KaiB
VPTHSVRFTLYIAGDSPRSRAAEANLRHLASARLGSAYELTGVDVVREPARAEAVRILTTPTLVKESPGLPRRVTGDLSDSARLWVILDLDALTNGPRHDT